MKKFLFFSVLALLLQGCPQPFEDISYHPIYAPNTDTLIQLEAPRPAGELNRVFYKDGYILFVEVGVGIHVFDYRDKNNPQNIGFVKVSGCQEVEMKNSTIYTRQFNDLLAIDLQNINKLSVKRFTQIFEEDEVLPPTGYFECPDPNKGVVIAWEEDAKFIKYECYR